ncbi:hypothetical protein [Pseudanabaena sp. PCC 6802]|uniref:hypothetical protein n=1 Tax=Pseudanabaena sp. PCC 6802 TaxID=118173 RepID=UPI0012E9A112|nr:hypothetical protein [Pseudanabaena sp. PCC 6802]
MRSHPDSLASKTAYRQFGNDAIACLFSPTLKLIGAIVQFSNEQKNAEFNCDENMTISIMVSR